MSSSLNCRIVDLVAPSARRADGDPRPAAVPSRGVLRRRLLLGLAGLPLAAYADGLPLTGLKRWGQGEFRRFGFLVYEATLWAGDDPSQPPLALRLDYRRKIAGSAIADASIREMRKFGAEEATLQRWGERLRQLFPDVAPGDHITGLYQPGRAAFLFNGREIGEVAEAEFARQFFAIWLDPRTSAPELRNALLSRSG